MRTNSKKKIPDAARLPAGQAFADAFCSLRSMPLLARGVVQECEAALARAQQFNEAARHLTLEHDRRTFEDPEYMPWDLIRLAGQWGFYSMFVPRFFGGQGVNMLAMACVIEEISSVCVGLANVMFVHYLGIAGIMFSPNLRLLRRIFGEVVAQEKSETPCLICLAITEPGAGTDVEDIDLIDRAQLGCFAKKSPGGYVVNGTKIFISMGHVSRWCCLFPYDRDRKASETGLTLAVRAGTKGFSAGKQEDKMGQRVCTASELVFEDCFVPDDNVLFDNSRGIDGASMREMKEMGTHIVLSMTRAGVGAFGTGVARGAFEDAMKFANGVAPDGRKLIDREWVQSLLADMYRNAALGRMSYLEAIYANVLPGGIYGFFLGKNSFYVLKYMPRFIIDYVLVPLLMRKTVRRLIAKFTPRARNRTAVLRASGWASLAKVVGTDAGVTNARLALQLAGSFGLRHENEIEKRLRDSKLLQIYEGTNQLNRLNLFYCIPGRESTLSGHFQE